MAKLAQQITSKNARTRELAELLENVCIGGVVDIHEGCLAITFASQAQMVWAMANMGDSLGFDFGTAVAESPMDDGDAVRFARQVSRMFLRELRHTKVDGDTLIFTRRKV